MTQLSALSSNYTVLHALDGKRIEEESKENQKISLFQQIELGIKAGIENFPKNVFIGLIVVVAARVFKAFLPGISPADLSDEDPSSLPDVLSFTTIVVQAPISEEVLFRGILQTGICVVQKAALWIAPRPLKDYRVFIWITSLSCRILVVNTLFAAVHLHNVSIMGMAFALNQVITILLLPSESILYETTGSLVAPIFSHMTNNFMAYWMMA